MLKGSFRGPGAVPTLTRLPAQGREALPSLPVPTACRGAVSSAPGNNRRFFSVGGSSVTRCLDRQGLLLEGSKLRTGFHLVVALIDAQEVISPFVASLRALANP